MITPGWRPQPPNEDERRECRTWWLLSSRSENIHIVVFSPHDTVFVDFSTSSVYIDILEWPGNHPGTRFDPHDWPGEWAPCLPPPAVVS